MFCDLCFAWQANGLTQRERLVIAIRLGIDLFALGRVVSEHLPDRDKCIMSQVCYVSMLDILLITFDLCRCSMQPLALASLQSGTPSLQDALRMQQSLACKHSSKASINQLTRLTLRAQQFWYDTLGATLVLCNTLQVVRLYATKCSKNEQQQLPNQLLHVSG